MITTVPSYYSNLLYVRSSGMLLNTPPSVLYSLYLYIITKIRNALFTYPNSIHSVSLWNNPTYIRQINNNSISTVRFLSPLHKQEIENLTINHYISCLFFESIQYNNVFVKLHTEQFLI